jgi:hypothetical protein
MEGGHVYGRADVRDYWTRQWAMIDPHVEPVKFSTGPEGELMVDVRQIVHDLKATCWPMRWSATFLMRIRIDQTL